MLAGERPQLRDTRLGELMTLLDGLVAATRLWAGGADPGPETDARRRRALVLNHLRYLELVPGYRRVAEETGGDGEVEVDFLVDNLLLQGFFKSYDPAWLAEADFAALTRWLGEVSCLRPRGDADTIRDLVGWRAWLRARGVFLSLSSGTSGRMSFVPRDLATLRALASNGAAHTDESWRAGPNGEPREFDCLVAGPRGEGMGILDAANGLSRSAVRAHFLFDHVADPQALGSPDGPTPGEATDHASGDAAEAECYRRAAEFVRASAREGRLLLVFGVPFLVLRLCRGLAATGNTDLRAIPGSLVVTGGGWKSFAGRALSREALSAAVEAALAIDAAHAIDAYSTSELNCTLRTCGEGRYHVPPLVEPVVLDEGLFGTVGGTGRGLLAFLDPFALSYPGFVITGDLATLGRDSCPCGLRGPFLEGEIRRAPGAEIRGCGGALAELRV